MLRLGLLGCLLLFSSSLWAMPFKCDKAQNLCEVQTKRLTIGDKVGIFSGDGQLVALGEVIEIRDRIRLVKINQKWGLLLRSFEMEIIEDEKAQNPEKFFRILTPLPELSWGANLGAINLGIGDSFLGTSVEGMLLWSLWRDMFLTGRLHYITGVGKASDNLGAAGTQDVSLTSFGLSGGVSELLLPYSLFAIRLDGELGFSNTSITLSGDFDEVKVLNYRIRDGIGVYVRLGAAAIWRRDGIQPELGFSFVRLHYANNPSLFIGLSAPVN
jgi:hypothetical protein